MGSGVKYSPEFRVGAVREVLDSSRPVKAVAEELSIRPETLRGWIYRARNGTCQYVLADFLVL